ncbi:MAG: regulatory signaling modulator protein AmpE [Gammaproteobacteria bacterium]|nr:regulatory signaling modulator protein AmpE [Gammaproteobacteria bacterium]MCW5582296.1 regulatory signaling modulator protein AmpE [Gammaproteobacteria bacterium]
MTFVVTLIALLIERFFDWSHLRRWNWYTNYQQRVAQRFRSQSPYLILIFTIVPLLIMVILMNLLLRNALFGLAGLLFQLLIFLYCLGPQNLWADTFACINALTQGNTQLAAEKLKVSFGLVEAGGLAKPLSNQLLNNIFIAANRRVFAIVFWFMVLGPVGAVLYRALTLSAAEFSQQGTAPELVQSARSAEAVLDWVPVRLFTCAFALGGHFVKVFSCWHKKNILRLDVNETLLTECGAAALGRDGIENPADGTAARSAIELLDRSFVIALVLVAFVVLLF